MDTSIDNLIQCISDSIKRKDEEIANLKLEIKNSESVLKTYEKRVRKLEEEIKKSECENSALREKIKELEGSNNTCAQFFEEVFGKLPQEFSVDDFKMSIDKRIKAAYDNGFREAERKYVPEIPADMYTIEEIVTKIFGNCNDVKTFDDIRHTISQECSKAHNVGYNDGYGAAIGKMVAFVNKIKFDPASNTKQDRGTLKKALAADYGKCYFKVYKCATIRNKLNIIKALKDIYNVPLGEIKSYVASLPVNGYGSVVLLDKVSDTTCKKLREALGKVQIECDYFYI